MVDAPNPAYIPKELVDSALDFIHESLLEGRRVLVHCNQGFSRSPAIGLLYLAKYTDLLPKQDFFDAEAAFVKLYPAYQPATGVRGFMQLNWGSYASPDREEFDVLLNEEVGPAATLNWFASLGYEVLHGGDRAGEPAAERDTSMRCCCRPFARRLARLNPDLPPAAMDEAIRKIRTERRDPVQQPRLPPHADRGVDVTTAPTAASGTARSGWSTSTTRTTTTGWRSTSSRSIEDQQRTNRRPDVVVFVNGLPLAVIELKNPADENATHRSGLQPAPDLQGRHPGLFDYNEVLVVSDGTEAAARAR